MSTLNIYEMYIKNKCRFGFYVHRDSWHPIKYAKVTAIEDVEEGKMIEGESPYFGRTFPHGHPKAGKKMGSRLVMLEADWMDKGFMEVNGGMGAFTQVYPDGPEFSVEDILGINELRDPNPLSVAGQMC
jgi:hypothetical protein